MIGGSFENHNGEKGGAPPLGLPFDRPFRIGSGAMGLLTKYMKGRGGEKKSLMGRETGVPGKDHETAGRKVALRRGRRNDFCNQPKNTQCKKIGSKE